MKFADKLNRHLLKQFPPDIIGRELSYTEISKRLNKALRPLKIAARVVRSQIIDDNERVRPVFDILGSTEDEKLILTVLVSQKREYYSFTAARYQKFLFLVSMTAQHELIHREQLLRYPKAFYRRVDIGETGRVGKPRLAEMDYYREWREIDAYAHDIAMEINFFYPTLDKLRILRHIDRYRKLSHYRRYQQTFAGVEWSEVRKLLLKKIIRWLPSAKSPLDKPQ